MKKSANAGTSAEGVPDAEASAKPGTPADAALKTPDVNISAMVGRDGKPQGRQEKGEGHGDDKKEAANSLKGAGPEPGRSQDMKDLLTARTGEESLLREAEGAATPFKEQSAAKELNRSHARTETDTRPAAFAQIERTTNPEGAAKAPQVAAPREIFTVAERTFVIMRKNEESIEVSVEPDGIGKLEIELNMDKGIINARINASDPIGKEIIERNLNDILNTLVREGIAIGGFSVSLRDNPRPPEEDLPGDRGTKGDLKETKDCGKVQAASVHDENRVVSIFV
jgi:flagellar hook-length control protein FliK